ncbi:MAG: hypothetical protein SFT92_01370 [Rickettsiales bacterium]|nr:hypothetical protein [Rickettsiales bacterium]
MSDTQTPFTPTPPPNKAAAAVKKFVFTMGVLLVFWLIFLQVVPRVLFPSTPSEPAQAPVTHDQASQDVPADTAEPIALPDDAIGKLEAKIQALESLVTNGAPATGSHLEQRLDALETNFAQLPKSDASEPIDEELVIELEAKIAEQSQAIAELRSELQQLQTTTKHELSLWVAIQELDRALQEGNSFEPLLATIAAKTANDAAITAITTQLAAYAKTGVPTLAQLQKQLDDAILAGLHPKKEGISLLDNARSLVTIRKVGNVAGSDDAAVMARLELQVNKGDIAQARHEFMQLSATAQQAMGNWKTQAESYLNARALLANLRALVMTPATPAAPVAPAAVDIQPTQP